MMIRAALLLVVFAAGVFVGYRSSEDCYRPGGVKESVTLQ